MKKKILIGLGIFIFGFTSIAAAAPQYINYQGVLRDSGGNLVTGNKAMTFKIYNAASGGTELWSMTSSEVAVNNGLYTIKLGPITPAELGTGSRWIDMTVDGATLSPRLEILAVAYAITAASAESASKVGGYSVSSSGNNIIPVTDGTGKLDSSVIPNAGINVSHADTADYATVSGTATNAANADTVDGLDANATPTAGDLYPLDSNGKLSGVPVSAEAASGFALFVNGGKIGIKTGTNMSAGTGKIVSGNISIVVSNTAVTASSIILLTVGHSAELASPNTNGGIRISARNVGTDFTVSTMNNAVASNDIPFSYLIIN